MNPYSVLGIEQNATAEEIKSAYRTLVKKYHPDRFAGDARMAKASTEKLKQINEAYDILTKMRQGGGNTYSTSPEFSQIRAAINRGDIATAEMLLDKIAFKTAEWHYLKGVVLLRRGWYDGAKQHFEEAYRMEPANEEYKNAFATINQTVGGYRDFYGGDGGTAANTLCKFCAVCSALNCCCNCC